MDDRLDIAALSKADLHRHLEGSIRPATAVELGKALGVFPSAMTVHEFVRHAVIQEPVDLFEALARFDLLRRPVRGFAALVRIAKECVEDAAADGVTHSDLRFSPLTLAKSSELPVEEVFRAVSEGTRAAVAEWPEVRVEVVAIISRRHGLEAAWEVVRQLETDAGGFVDGVDFASDEHRHRTAEFTDVAQALMALGLPLTVHTGEGIDASAVEEALALPGVRRLGHALSLVDEQRLVDEVIAREITVEVCPTSNVRSKTVNTLREHPVRAMREMGVRVVICTDDPALFGVDLTHELQVARLELGFTDAQIVECQRWGKEAFFGE